MRNNGTVLGPAACSVLDFLSYGVLAPASLHSTSGTFSTASHITSPWAVTGFSLSGLYWSSGVLAPASLLSTGCCCFSRSGLSRTVGLLECWPRRHSFPLVSTESRGPACAGPSVFRSACPGFTPFHWFPLILSVRLVSDLRYSRVLAPASLLSPGAAITPCPWASFGRLRPSLAWPSPGLLLQARRALYPGGRFFCLLEC